MKGILLVGKFTNDFRKINKKLMGKYEVRACIRQLNIIEGMLERKVPDLIVMLLDEEETEDSSVKCALRVTYPDLPVIWLEYALTEEVILKKIEQAINGEDIEEQAEKKEEKKEEKEEVLEEVPVPKKTWEKPKKKVVLMVDDSGVFLRTMKSMVEEHYEVRMSTSGLHIQGLIQEHHPDIVLLDYDMPLFDGRQTMMKIRECEEMKDIPIVFVTGVNKKEHIIQVLNLKPAGYILKPVEKDRILQTIRDIIGE